MSESALRASAERPRIDLVSPLPPVRSGIADYSADLLKALDARCRLRLVHLPEQEVDPALARRWPLVPPSALAERDGLPLYQMGNNHYHDAVYDLALAHPGVLTLHDLVLHHFLIGRTASRDDFDGYQDALAREHGWIGAAAAMPLRWPSGVGDAAQFALPAHRQLLCRQRGVLTHSRWAADQLREEIEGLRVRAIPMGIPLPPKIDAEAGHAFRAQHDIPATAPLLGTFGFQTRMKRTRAVLRALASEALADVFLLVGGAIAPDDDLVHEAETLGVAERVRFLGFLPFDAFEAAIAAVDLCLNLRYPTAGETSASLLRILAIGKPAVVSDHAQSADLPDAGLIKIPTGDEEDAALRALGARLGDRAGLAALGDAGREHIAQHHQPEASAAAIVDACRAWRTAEPLGDRPADVRPMTSLLTWKPRGTIRVEGTAGWRPGTRRTLRIEVENHGDVTWLAGERVTGGVAFELQMISGERDWLSGHPWLRLPRDLPAGGRERFTVRLRRPLTATTLRIAMHVLAESDMHRWADVPGWEAAL